MVEIAPGTKAAHGAKVGRAGMRIADGGGEKFNEPVACLVSGLSEEGWDVGGVEGLDGGIGWCGQLGGHGSI